MNGDLTLGADLAVADSPLPEMSTLCQMAGEQEVELRREGAGPRDTREATQGVVTGLNWKRE